MKTTGWRTAVAVKEEVTPNTLIAVLAADCIRVIEAPRTYQPIENLISQERINSLDVDALIRDAAAPGDGNIKVYCKASGTAGTPVQAGLRAVLLGLFGREAVTGGTSVVYDPLRIDQDTRKTYSIYKKFGDGMVYQNSGCVFNTADWNLRKRGQESILQMAAGFSFQRQYWAGKTVTAGTPTTTSVPVAAGTAKFFSPGAFITITGITESGNAFIPISAINYSTDTLTVPTLSAAPAAGIALAGYFPTPTDSGHKISGWRGVSQLGGSNIRYTELDIHLDNKIGIIDDEQNGTQYPDGFLEGEDKREVTVRLKQYFDSTVVGGMAARYQADAQVQQALSAVIGDVAGRIWTFTCPALEDVSTPEEDDSGRVFITRTFRSLGTDNVLKLTLT